jgi:hypothetical protein
MHFGEPPLRGVAAEPGGHEIPAERRTDLAKKMTPDRIGEGERRASAWKPN